MDKNNIESDNSITSLIFTSFCNLFSNCDIMVLLIIQLIYASE